MGKHDVKHCCKQCGSCCLSCFGYSLGVFEEAEELGRRCVGKREGWPKVLVIKNKWVYTCLFSLIRGPIMLLLILLGFFALLGFIVPLAYFGSIIEGNVPDNLILGFFASIAICIIGIFTYAMGGLLVLVISGCRSRCCVMLYGGSFDPDRYEDLPCDSINNWVHKRESKFIQKNLNESNTPKEYIPLLTEKTPQYSYSSDLIDNNSSSTTVSYF